MKKTGILNKHLAGELAALGHTDAIVIADAGLPIPAGSNVVDLALVGGIPSFTDTLEAVLNEIIVEKFELFAPMREANPAMYKTVTGMMPKQDFCLSEPEKFIDAVRSAKVVVRTAERTPCCNIILYSASGVEEMCRPLEVSFPM